MENAAEKIICPACQRADARYLGTRHGYRLFKSAFCGFLFVWPTPSDTAFVYSEDYFSGAHQGFGYVNYDQDKAPQEKALTIYLERMQKVLGHTGHLLDVGTANGYFVTLAIKKGWEASGVELSPFASSVGRERGLNIVTGTIHESKLDDTAYDAITLWDVFEHVQNPESDLKRIYDLLALNGILAINTPDSGSLWARLWGIRWNMIVPPEHLFLFNPAALSAMLSRAGFSIVYRRNIGKSFSIPYILHIVHSWTGLSVFRRLSDWTSKTFLSRLHIPLNTGDTMFVIAKKA